MQAKLASQALAMITTIVMAIGQDHYQDHDHQPQIVDVQILQVFAIAKWSTGDHVYSNYQI